MINVQNYPSNPKKLWQIFYDFTQTPRPSKKEERIQAYLIALAQANGLIYKKDTAGNIIIYVPGTKLRESEDALIIQNHIDMVTDAVQGKVFNFSEQSLELEVIDGWLKAKGTTLGADNGVGCAAALAIIFEKDISHPPLELLFTTDEETGLHGALNLDASNFKATRMLNLDTEEWGSFYIGCAGGIDYDFNKDYEVYESQLKNHFKVEINGFIGGHSGLNIIDQRANAIKVVCAILSELNDFEISELRFGKAHNIIPRDGFVDFYTNLTQKEIQKKLDRVKREYLGFLPKNDHDFSFSLSSLESSSQSMSKIDSKKFITFLQLFPSGVRSMDLESNREIVSCSNNLAKALFVRGKAYILTSIRFFDRNEAKSIEREIVGLADILDFRWQNNSEYPSWKPVRENKVLETLIHSYKSLYNKEPIITAIHAGLECGILKDKLGEMDVCSFGPTIHGAHSPDERVEIKSVELFWNLLKETLKNI